MKNKKVVAIGGGSGLSSLLVGLKNFPLDITAVVSVCDDGRSTGKLREEFNIPAVGDIRQVISSLSETNELMAKLLNYRFKTTSDLNGHSVGNLMLTALSQITGNMSDGIEVLSDVLKLKGHVLPLTEQSVTLVGKMKDGRVIEGEHHITEADGVIESVYYKEKDVAVNQKVIDALMEADLIIFSMGSLFTSIIPDLLCGDIIKTLDEVKAPLMYICNIMTQPGETDGFKVSDHVKLLNSYLGKRKLDIVIANNGEITEELAHKYETEERKDPVIYDLETENIVPCVIKDDLVDYSTGVIRHNSLNLSLYIFKEAMK